MDCHLHLLLRWSHDLHLWDLLSMAVQPRYNNEWKKRFQTTTFPCRLSQSVLQSQLMRMSLLLEIRLMNISINFHDIKSQFAIALAILCNTNASNYFYKIKPSLSFKNGVQLVEKFSTSFFNFFTGCSVLSVGLIL